MMGLTVSWEQPWVLQGDKWEAHLSHLPQGLGSPAPLLVLPIRISLVLGYQDLGYPHSSQCRHPVGCSIPAAGMELGGV